MNIVQLHERVRFWLDSVSSPRFESQDIDNGLNVAIEMKIMETYDQNRPMNRSDSFQRTQRCRDILGPLVKLAVSGTSGFTFANNKITIASTSDYRLLLSLGIVIGSTTYECNPLTYDRKTKLASNPFRKVRMTPNARMYYNEIDGNIEITHAYTGALSNFSLYYLKNPLLVNYGIEYTSTKAFNNGNIIYAVEQTVHNGVTYKIGDAITIVNPFLNITSGLVTFGYVDCELRSLVHEEISRRAAINCLMTTGSTDKVELLRKEITAQ